MKQYKVAVRKIQQPWCGDLNATLTALNRRRELKCLIAWASRKNLQNPLRLYQNRLEDEEKRLLHYAIAAPRLTNFAYLLFRFNKLTTPTPRYFPRGSAATYRTNYLTQAAYQS